MKKKTVKNRYGVQVGDIFNIGSYHEDGGGYSFYQVIALRGETQVAVREIGSQVIAFDGVYEGVVPVPNTWISDDVLIRKIHETPKAPGEGQKAFKVDTYSIDIKIFNNWLGYAHLDKKEIYLAWYNGPCLACQFEKYNPEIAKYLNLKHGSGVFATDRPFKSIAGEIADDCRAVIRYPDGSQQETTLNVLLHYAEEKREYERLNSPEFALAREKSLDEWMESQKGAFTDG